MSNILAAYGIDLGTTYSAVAKIGPTGAPEIIANTNLAKDLLASAVYFREDGKVVVGDEAKEEAATNPERLMQFFKRWIGLKDDPEREVYIVDGNEYDPIQLSAMVLQEIVNYAKENGEDVHDVVITCPAYFSDQQRGAIVQAGEVVGLNVMAIINEPTSAAINYCFNRYNEDQTVLVYDLGGGTFDVTLMRMSEDNGQRNIEVLGTNGDSKLGGREWDEELYNIIIDKYKNQYGRTDDDITIDLENEIRSRVEEIKIKLSTKESYELKMLHDGESIKLTVTREEFERATSYRVDETVGWLNRVINDAGYTDDKIDIVLLVGSSTKMPMIRKMLSDRFGEKVVFADPDKAVAKGAAIIAHQKILGATGEFLDVLQQRVARGELKLSVDSDGNITIDGELPDDINNTLEKKFKEIMEGTGVNVEEHTDEEGHIDIGSLASVVQTIKDESPTNVVVQDIAARTFGIVVIREDEYGNTNYAVDNIIHMGDKTPFSDKRTYGTPRDNVEQLSLPVIESVSTNEYDVIDFDEKVLKPILPNDEREMKQCSEMVLRIPRGLPKNSKIIVTFSVDELSNVSMTATEPTSNTTESVAFNFNDVSAEKLDEFKRIHANTTYVLPG